MQATDHLNTSPYDMDYTFLLVGLYLFGIPCLEYICYQYILSQICLSIPFVNCILLNK